MVKPVIVINLKTYTWGKNTVRLAKRIEKACPTAILGVQPSDVALVAANTRLPVYSGHADPHRPGRYTGYVLPEAVKGAGARGVFLNHSEHRVPFKVLRTTILRCKKIGLRTLVFAKNLSEAKKIEKLRPSYLVIEPPELVAGAVSVSKAKPDFIKKIAENLKTPFLVGAGIKTKEDIRIAMKLGASGVAFASVITKAKNPAAVLRKLTQ